MTRWEATSPRSKRRRVRINIDLPDEVHLQVRRLCIESRHTMAQVIVAAVENYVHMLSLAEDERVARADQDERR